MWAAAAKHEPPVSLPSCLAALHGSLGALFCLKCQKSFLYLGSRIFTSQHKGTASQSYPVSSFLCCFHLGAGFHGSESLTWYICPYCTEIVAITWTSLWGAWQTYLSCSFQRSRPCSLHRRARLMGWKHCVCPVEPLLWAGATIRRGEEGRRKECPGRKRGNKGRSLGEETSLNTQRSREDWKKV